MSAYWAFRSNSGTCMAALTVIALTVSSRVGPALVLEQLLHGDLAPRPGRGPPHDGASRHVARHERPRRHECILADLDAGEQHRPGADATAPTDRNAFEVLEALRRAPDVVVVRGHDAGCDEHTVFERRVGRDVALAFQLAVAADGANVLDRHAAPHDGPAAHAYILADRAQVGPQDLVADGGTAIQHHAAAHDTLTADRQGRELLFLGSGGIGGAHRAFAERGMIVDAHLIADHGAVVDDDVVPEPGAGTDSDLGSDHASLAEHDVGTQGCGGIDQRGRGTGGAHEIPAICPETGIGVPPASRDA